METVSPQKRYWTREEVAKHSTAEDCYTIVGNKVYDVTHYLHKHPGGGNLIFRNAGKDSTKDFEAMYHSQRARKLLDDFLVGELVKSAVPASLTANYPLPQPRSSNPILNAVSNNTMNPPTFVKSNNSGKNVLESVSMLLPMSPTKSNIPSNGVSPMSPSSTDVNVAQHTPNKPEMLSKTVFQKFKCCAKQFISHDTAIFKFKLPSATAKLRIKEGRHVQIAVFISKDDGKTYEQVVRKYTPVKCDEKGTFELLVKHYPGGALSTFFHHLILGDEILMRGPFGSFKNGKSVRLMYPKTYLFCAGTGLAPMWQILQKNLSKKSRQLEPTTFVLVFSNKTEEDILLRTELELLTVEFPQKLQVFHVLSQETSKEKNPNFYDAANVFYLYKRLDAQVIEEELGFADKVDAESRVLICGPDAYCEMIKSTFIQLGFLQEQVHVF